jgi:hypothetical protein
MNVTWGGKTYPCRRVECGAGYLRQGDFTLYQGQMCKVITVQRECVTIESLRKFVMVTLETKDHSILPVRAIPKREVFRPSR